MEMEIVEPDPNQPILLTADSASQYEETYQPVLFERVVDAGRVRDSHKISRQQTLNTKGFKDKFGLFTNNLFAEFAESDWSNIVVAGGSVIHPLLDRESIYIGSAGPLNLEGLWPNADIDLFVYGISNPTEATKKLEYICTALEKALVKQKSKDTYKFIGIRTAHTLSLESASFSRAIQIVLRLYNTKEEILSKFDVDCCAVCWDGKEVWATPRAIRAIINMCNVYDPKHRKGNSWYEDRLEKYARRGFDIAIKKDSDIYNKYTAACFEVKHVQDCKQTFGRFWEVVQTKNFGFYRLAYCQAASMNSYSFFLEERSKILPLPKARPDALIELVKKRSQFPRSVYEATGMIEANQLEDFFTKQRITWSYGSFDGPAAKELEQIWSEGLNATPPVVTTNTRMTREKVRMIQLLNDYVKRHPQDESPKALAHRELKKYYDKGPYEELHTHLLGMGSVEFWYDVVMKGVLPLRLLHCKNRSPTGQFPEVSLIKSWFGPKLHLKDDQSEVSEFWKGWHIPMPYQPLSHANFGRDPTPLSVKSMQSILSNFEKYADLKLPLSKTLVAHLKSSEARSPIEVFQEEFTFDVVYSHEVLAVAFGYFSDPNPKTKLQHQFGQELKPLIYFNQRKQYFDYCCGLTNDSLLKLASPSSRGVELIKDSLAFSETKHNGFSPYFYPQRYKLRDCIYEQNLDVLDLLLHHIVHRYHLAHVSYAELSVGVNDLCSPNVYRHLVLSTPKLSSMVQLTFLAGFSRTTWDPDKQQTLPTRKDVSKEKLEELKKCYDESLAAAFTGDEKILPNLLFRKLVGLDWNGDESLNSDCHFVDEDFIQFMKFAQEKTKRTFGARIHAGEYSVPDQGITSISNNNDLEKFVITKQKEVNQQDEKPISKQEKFSRHMINVINDIETLLKNKIQCRIGHGVCFANFYNHNAHAHWPNSILESVNFIRSKCIIEINNCSNKILISDVSGGTNPLKPVHALKILLKNGWKVCLSTDNDGIFKIEIPPQSNPKRLGLPFPLYSLAAEFMKGYNDDDWKYSDLEFQSARFGVSID